MNFKLLFVTLVVLFSFFITNFLFAQENEAFPKDPEETFETVSEEDSLPEEENKALSETDPDSSKIDEVKSENREAFEEVKPAKKLKGRLVLANGAIKLTRGDQYAIIRDSDLRYANVIDGDAVPIKTMIIKEQDEIHVAGNSDAKLTFIEGEVFVELSAKSHLEISTISEDAVEIAFRAGEAEFNVEGDSDKGYIVRTHNAVIKGANVRVRIENGKTIIETNDKSVKVAAISEPENEIIILPFGSFSLNQNVLPVGDQAENLTTKGTRELVDELTSGTNAKKDGPRNVTATITFE